MGSREAVRAESSIPGPPDQRLSETGSVTFAACVEGNWDIYSLNLGHGVQRLTHDPAQDRDPAWSPDGQYLAFSSRRDGNWELYVLSSHGLARLTDDLAYDGLPDWSPDGRYLAFVSSRAGDLDIWLADIRGESVPELENLRNLTPDVPAGDFAPAWSPDGRWIAFSSWREGDKDIFLVSPSGNKTVQLTSDEADEDSPVWSADGQRLFFVRRPFEGSAEVWEMMLDLSGDEPTPGTARQLTWLGGADSPALSEQAGTSWLLVRWTRYDGEMLLALDPAAVGTLPVELTGLAAIRGPLRWLPDVVNLGELAALGSPRYPTASPPPDLEADHPYGWADLAGVETSWPSLSEAVVADFQAWRAAVKAESGYDFLGRLSEARRALSFDNESTDYASWHKAGRAVDLQLDGQDETGRPLLELVPEFLGGELFWRLYLRCDLQDGSQGEPMTVRPWEFNYAAEEGSRWAARRVPAGYYLDLTDLARQYGWERISAWDSPGFSWRRNYRALEYWHFQRRDGRLWYQAMLEVRSPTEIQTRFAWPRMREHNVAGYLLLAKGVPVPPEEARWWRLQR